MDTTTHSSAIKKLIDEYQIDFTRGDIDIYFGNLTQVLAGLTLPSVTDKWTAVYLKNVYTLWNILVDDEIDRENSRSGLDASFAFLASGSISADSHVAARLLKLLLEKLGRYEGLGRQFLLEIAQGFNYEHLINSDRKYASTEGYLRNSTLTASIKYFISVDLALSNTSFDFAEITSLVDSYQYFSVAIKLASDLGSFQREISDEQNLNYPILLAIKGNNLDPETVFSLKKEELSEMARSNFDSIRSEIKEHFQKGLTSLERISTIDISILKKTVTRIITQYSNEEDPFFLTS